VARRRAIKARYRAALDDGRGITFMPDAPDGEPTNWLTVAQIDPEVFGATTDDVRLALEGEDIESRPAWKPLHCQPVFTERPAIGGTVAERIFERGLCLPSGSSLTDAEVDRIVELVRAVPSHPNR